MGIGIIIGGLFLIIGIIYTIIEQEGICAFFGVIFGGFMFLVVSLTSAAIYGAVVGVETIELNSTAIYSIGLRDNIQRSFTLGCGGISTESVYAYYTQDEDGCFILKKTYCRQSKIKETNDISPCIKRYGEIFKNGKTSWMWAYGNYIYGDPDHYIIYIPEGSIVQTYNLTP